MSEAAPSSDLPPPSRSGRLLSLVRKLVAYGNQLIATLHQHHPSAEDRAYLTCTFGARNLLVILARIALGVQRAKLLAEKIHRTAVHIDAGPQSEPAPPPGASRAIQSTARPRGPRLAQPTESNPTETLSLLPRLPNPDQIAASVRRKPIGAVLADICRALGIGRDHPLWDELHAAIIEFGGSVVGLVGRRLNHLFPIARVVARLNAKPEAPPEPDSRGPPLAPA